MRVRDLPGCAWTMALAFSRRESPRWLSGPNRPNPVWLRRVEAAATVVPFALIALTPGTWHRDRVVVANLRRQRTRPGSKVRTALLVAVGFVVGVALCLELWALAPRVATALFAVVMPLAVVLLVIGLWMQHARNSIWKAKDPAHITEEQTVPAADWVGTGFARRPGCDLPGADIIFRLAEELARPDGTLGLIARHRDLVPVYAAHGLEPVEEGSWRMTGRPRGQRTPLDDNISRRPVARPA
ncbi:hypothetical protein [Xylanimonas cellulosilytica]|nr:hypothetical protein [Xylanimonas cellulosilytica]